MTNTRRVANSPDKKSEGTSGRKRKAVKQVVVQPTEELPEASRPKRNARKSVLFTSGEYEVNYPGTVKEEEIEEEIEGEEVGSSHSQENVKALASVDIPINVEKSMPPPPPVAENLLVGSVTRGRPRRQAPHITPISHQEQMLMQDAPRQIVMQMEVNETVELIQEEEEENGNEMEHFDIDHLGQEVDVETMSNLEELDHDEMMKAYQFDDEMMSEQGDEPPLLERAGEMKRRRGRPRKYPQGQTPFRRTNIPTPRRTQIARDPTAPSPRNKYTYDKPLTKVEAEKINSFNVKLFEDQIMSTEHGDVYATVIPGCLSYLLRKERIIELLTSRTEIQTIREQGWMMNKPPRLPPLTTSKTCYAFYIDGSSITSIRDLSTDDLKPWTTSSNDPSHNEPVVKPNVRKHPIIRQGGRLVPTKGDPRSAEIHLTEYSAWLPRCLRLRKKIFYLARAGHIIGNVLILYDFTTPGDIPVLLNVIHGNEAFRGSHTDEEFERGHVLFVGDNENPFEEEMVEGPRMERFFSVRPDRYGWTNNKKLLLKWLINEPQLLEQSDFLNHRIPYLPPLIEGRGVFVFFAPASLIGDQLHFTGDGLSPWTYQGASVNHRVRTVKKALIQDVMGQFQTSKEEWQSTGLALVETITILCRCPRLRKRIIYVQRSNTTILGNVCWIYEYMQPGPLPEIVKTNNRASNAALASPPDQILLRANPGDKPDPRLLNDDDVDVEELVEEVVTHDEMGHPTIGSAFSDSLDFEDLPEDSLNAGWDTEFEEDVLVSQESSSPFFEGVRSLEDGHTYLTVRHKRVLCNTDTILEFIANSDFVDEKGLMNTSKPSHPPLVRNARAYVFFVNGNVVFPHDINRDDFSPWSANATPDRPTCYRSKVRKYGIVQDPKSRRYVMQDGDYKLFPYHLVSLYSIHPKEDRLRKRIHYLMETATKVIISHVMIMYDYNQEGSIPRINGPYGKRMIRRRPLRRLTGDMSEVLEDVSEESESEKPSPFSGNCQAMDTGETYLVLEEIDFLQDRNRQLHYLYNKPYLLEQLGCLNNHVPQLPPMTPGRGAFVFFIDGQVDSRILTCDGLGPWSENYTHTDGSVICRRPKTHRIPLGLNQNSQLRVIRGKKFPPVGDGDYQLHVYAATLPRCHRVKKRVVYITKDNIQIGMAMIAYWYSEDGEIPTQVTHGNAVHTDGSFIRLPQPVRDEAKQMLLNQMAISDIVKELSLKHNMPIHPRTINFLKRELRQAGQIEADLKIEGDAGFDGDDSMADYVPADWAETSGTVEEDISAVRARRLQQTGLQQTDRQDAHISNQLFRYVKNLVGARTDDDAFDHVWKALVLKNEQRVLRNIKSDFGVEIVADHADAEQMVEEIHGGIIEGEIVEEEILDEGQILEDVVMDDNSMILMRDETQEGILIQESSEGTDAAPKSNG